MPDAKSGANPDRNTRRLRSEFLVNAVEVPTATGRAANLS